MFPVLNHLVLAEVLKEAAIVLRNIPLDVAEDLQIREFLPDELEGIALMIESEMKGTEK